MSTATLPERVKPLGEQNVEIRVLLEQLQRYYDAVQHGAERASPMVAHNVVVQLAHVADQLREILVPLACGELSRGGVPR
ncbi:MAG: hypothetical protein DRJ03_01940 [Chloroflexi bacterium]|nr:MAG: hypothetical protein DRJ03_01940 [Chloroflexota bacterium]